MEQLINFPARYFPIFRIGTYVFVRYESTYSQETHKIYEYDSFHILNQSSPLDYNACARLLQQCITRKSMGMGKKLHDHMIRTGFKTDLFLDNSIVHMYVKCGILEDARQVFDEMPERNVVSWNSIIAGCTQHRQCNEAFKLFYQMQMVGVKPDQFTFVSVLRACGDMAAMDVCKQVPACILKSGFWFDVAVGNALVTMHGKCGNLENARKVFDKMPQRDVVSWTAMIAGYAQREHGLEALELFREMQSVALKPDHVTLASVVMACSSVAALEQGKQVHVPIVKIGFELDVSVGTTLFTMYAKCGVIEDAQLLFDKLPKRDLVSWNALIARYVEHGNDEKALKLFCQMQQTGMKPNHFSFASILRVCSGIATLELGRQVHGRIVIDGFESDAFVSCSLSEMYVKCGSIERAYDLFDKMQNLDVVSWNVMINGYAQHGYGKEALELFEEMKEVGFKPDHITFVGVLSACSHVGLADEGRHYFDSMSRDYGILPGMEHYACMVDLFGRAGCLQEAENFITGMPFEPSSVVWRSLLAACRIHGNMKIGKRVAECVLKLEPEDDSTYILLSNIYAAAGKWDEVKKLRNRMEDKEMKKEPGCSWVEVKSRVHLFFAEDRSHYH